MKTFSRQQKKYKQLDSIILPKIYIERDSIRARKSNRTDFDKHCLEEKDEYTDKIMRMKMLTITTTAFA